MKEIKMYESKDGKYFDSDEKCLEHDQHYDDLKAANDMFNNGATLFSALECANKTNPFWCAGLDSKDEMVLMSITKNTKFAVPHWQCSDNAGYTPSNISIDNKVFLYGNVGAWSGPYGSMVTLKDLVRYWRETVRRQKNKITANMGLSKS